MLVRMNTMFLFLLLFFLAGVSYPVKAEEAYFSQARSEILSKISSLSALEEAGYMMGFLRGSENKDDNINNSKKVKWEKDIISFKPIFLSNIEPDIIELLEKSIAEFSSILIRYDGDVYGNNVQFLPNMQRGDADINFVVGVREDFLRANEIMYKAGRQPFFSTDTEKLCFVHYMAKNHEISKVFIQIMGLKENYEYESCLSSSIVYALNFGYGRQINTIPEMRVGGGGHGYLMERVLSPIYYFHLRVLYDPRISYLRSDRYSIEMLEGVTADAINWFEECWGKTICPAN